MHCSGVPGSGSWCLTWGGMVFVGHKHGPVVASRHKNVMQHLKGIQAIAYDHPMACPFLCYVLFYGSLTVFIIFLLYRLILLGPARVLGVAGMLPMSYHGIQL